MIMKVKQLMTGWNVGRKNQKERSDRSFTLYDNCNICPLSVYVDLVCNNNLRSLIISGNPTDDEVEIAKISLILEFSELSGNTQTHSVNNLLKGIYMSRMQIKSIEMCINLISSGRYSVAKDYLKSIGISKVDVKYLQGVIKSKVINLKKDISRYDSLVKESGSKKPTAQFYNHQLAVLSKYLKFDVPMSITLAKYAEYLKLYNDGNNRK